MINLLKYLTIALAFAMAACTAQPAGDLNEDSELTLVLNISDAVAESRSAQQPDSPTPLANLRVIITRPDGQVEYNRLVYTDAVNTIRVEDLTFKIKRDAYKMVYLIGNEGSDTGSYADLTYISPTGLIEPDSDPSSVTARRISKLPTSEAVPLTAVYQLSTASEHAIQQGNKLVIKYSLSLMRAVTKFTFNIYNNRQIPVTISEIAVDNLRADDYYLFPRVVTTGGDEILHYIIASGPDLKESGTIDGAAVSSQFTDYYNANFKAAAVATDAHNFLSAPTTLNPSATPMVYDFYYYESNLPDGTDPDYPYTVYVSFDGNRYSAPLTNLKTLPRNTHVVVNMQFNNNDKPLEIEVLPYYSVDLYPGFGKKDD